MSATSVNDEENLHQSIGVYRAVGKTYRSQMTQKHLVDAILSDRTNIISSKKIAEQSQTAENVFLKLQSSVDLLATASSELHNEQLASEAMEEIAVTEMAAEIQETYAERMRRLALQDNIKTNENIINRLQEELNATRSLLQQKKVSLEELYQQSRSSSQTTTVKSSSIDLTTTDILTEENLSLIPESDSKFNDQMTQLGAEVNE